MMMMMMMDDGWMTGQRRHGREREHGLANPEERERDKYLFPSYELCRVLCIVSHWKLREREVRKKRPTKLGK